MMTPVTKYKRSENYRSESRYRVSRKNIYAYEFIVRTLFITAVFGATYATRFIVSDGWTIAGSKSRKL